MFDDVAWWTTDDYSRCATWATIALIRACADHQCIPVTDLVQQLAQRHNIELP